MKRILYLSYYFEPDLSAGSFRNSPLVKELAKQAKGIAKIEVLTTMPNRYDSSLSNENMPLEKEQADNYTIHRFKTSENKGGMKGQLFSYQSYYRAVRKFVRNQKFDLIIASSAKLLTAYLAHRIAKKQQVPLYLDIRDLFHENLENMLSDGIAKKMSLPLIRRMEQEAFSNATHINIISAGFTPNFDAYSKPNYTNFTNGIDEIFLNHQTRVVKEKNNPLKIVYAGNIGKGQGLHKIIPQAAKQLGTNYQFLIIGDGGSKPKLEQKLQELEVENVELRAPVERKKLLDIYDESDFTFVHLNDYDAFKKVIPSKIFELACFPQPMIAGISGFSNKFVSKYVKNHILFEPCDVDSLVTQLKNFDYQKTHRTEFMKNFKRSTINKKMAESMLEYIE